MRIIGTVRRTLRPMRICRDTHPETKRVTALKAVGKGTWYPWIGGAEYPAGTTVVVLSTWSAATTHTMGGGKTKGYKVLAPDGRVFFMSRTDVAKWCEAIE